MKHSMHRSTGLFGVSSLLTVFASVCLVLFALFGLQKAAAEEALSVRAAQGVEAYLQAECRAEEILASLRSGVVPEGVEETEGEYRYSCPISETQILQVRVRIRENGDYTILQWNRETLVEWQADSSLNVWKE